MTRLPLLLVAAGAAGALGLVPRRQGHKGLARLPLLRSATISGEAAAVDDAKAEFRKVLAASGNEPKAEEVVAAIEKLSPLSPTAGASAASPLNLGTFNTLSKPDFPESLGRDEETGNYMFTMGRLSFNVFRPLDLPCEIEAINNILRPAGADDGTSQGMDSTYDVLTRFKTKDGLSGEMLSGGYCTPNADEKDRLDVIFTKLVLRPAAGTDMDAWRETFGDAVQGKLRKRDRFTRFLLKLFMGMTPPGAMAEDGSITVTIGKPPKGYLDVLFLDDTLRITRGNRGSIVIVDREKEETAQA
mmetsp:Transcript_20718/g.63020  ORF Transcript_20718/g.63020 Transcript_20718/m.63020 type:complete len:301 (-) Transcript_20718:49-951(-)